MTTCEWWDLVSAAADGELDDTAAELAFRHARGCASCSTALDTAVPLAPHLVATPAPLDPARLANSERRWLGAHWARRLLLIAGLVVVAASIPAYVGGDGLTPDSHAARHLASWQIGFGVGLVVAATISRMSSALLSLAITFATLTIVARVIDVAGGQHGPWISSVHLVELIGVLLLWLLTPPHLVPRWRPGRVRDPAAGDRLRAVNEPGMGAQ